MKRWGWDEASKMLTVYDPESELALWEGEFSDFVTAKYCADSFSKLYTQGVRHGKLLALEEIKRTVDHIDRSI
jgi:hypothetical protein